MIEPHKGDVVFNGVCTIKLTEEPRYSDAIERWLARGCRWVKSRKQWEDQPHQYGWADGFHDCVSSPDI